MDTLVFLYGDFPLEKSRFSLKRVSPLLQKTPTGFGVFCCATPVSQRRHKTQKREVAKGVDENLAAFRHIERFV